MNPLSGSMNIVTFIALNVIYAALMLIILNYTTKHGYIMHFIIIFALISLYPLVLQIAKGENYEKPVEKFNVDPCRGMPEQYCRQNPKCAVDYTPEGAVCFSSGTAKPLMSKNINSINGYV